jgi:hypothetical protein
MDMHFDKGQTQIIESPVGPLVVESQGFIVFARVDTQDQARALKTLLRAQPGVERDDVNYDTAPPKVPA